MLLALVIETLLPAANTLPEAIESSTDTKQD